MAKITFPILPGNEDDHLCAWCGNGHTLLAPNSFANLCCGAVLFDYEDRDSAGPSDDMEGYLELNWHGAHSEEGGIGKHPDTFASVPLKKGIVGGQMGINFCSTECLRAFLNNCVNELELRIAGDHNSDS
jgi:hypothetical protein